MKRGEKRGRKDEMREHKEPDEEKRKEGEKREHREPDESL
jgi:hypothetical protein